MAVKHTPGPWDVRKTSSGNPFIYSGQLNVAGVAIARPGIDSATSAANASLIAAAPELLDALIALKTANGADNFNGWHEAFRPAIAMANAAIAKATGG